MKRKTLPPGTEINLYLIKKEIGQDFFGATYFVSHCEEETPRYQVREFFPANLSKRNRDNVLPARKVQTEEYERLRSRCGEIFSRLDGLQEAGLVAMLDQFEANNSLYLVANWPEGATLAEYQQETGALAAKTVRAMLDQILPPLSVMHQRGVVHCGLSSSAIFSDESGDLCVNLPYMPALMHESPIIAHPPEAMSPFKAPELEDEAALIAETADIYALGALVYVLLTDALPETAAIRAEALAAGKPDPLDADGLRAVVGEDQALAELALAAMSLDPKKRPATITDFVQFMSPPLFIGTARKPVEPELGWFNSWGRWAVAAAWILIAGLGLYFFLPREIEAHKAGEVQTVEVKTEPTIETTPSVEISIPAADQPTETALPVVTAEADASAPVEEEDASSVEQVTPASVEEITEPPITPESEPILKAIIPVEVSAEAEAWAETQAQDDWKAYEAFLEAYGDGPHGSEAEARLAELMATRERLIEKTRIALIALGAPLAQGRTMDTALSEHIAGFQDDEGLPLTGDVSEPLLEALELAVAQRLTLAEDTGHETGHEAEFEDCAGCPDMEILAAGSFQMGAPEGEPGRSSDELEPSDEVIEAAFAMMNHEVTRGEFQLFIEETGYRLPTGCVVALPEKPGYAAYSREANYTAPGFDQSDDHPVVCVSAEDAAQYAKWLSDKTGETYRLPSEAEWEYAARAGSETAYYWGARAQDACAHSNGADQSLPEGWIANACDDGFQTTSPVGRFSANANGLTDMAGNVWEWTSDCYEACPVRVIRGGSWASSVDQLRSAKRYSAQASSRYNTIGFRLVREQ